MVVTAPTMYTCENCGTTLRDDECRTLSETRDIALRLDSGGEVPAGECPRCGALVYSQNGLSTMCRDLLRERDELREALADVLADDEVQDGTLTPALVERCRALLARVSRPDDDPRALEDRPGVMLCTECAVEVEDVERTGEEFTVCESCAGREVES